VHRALGSLSHIFHHVVTLYNPSPVLSNDTDRSLQTYICDIHIVIAESIAQNIRQAVYFSLSINTKILSPNARVFFSTTVNIYKLEKPSRHLAQNRLQCKRCSTLHKMLQIFPPPSLSEHACSGLQNARNRKQIIRIAANISKSSFPTRACNFNAANPVRLAWMN
jgi:hypothetical protein